MALGRESINKLTQRINDSRKYLKKYQDEYQISASILQQNANYQSFIENTEIGKYLNEKLNEIKRIGDKASGDISKLLDATDSYVNEQLRFNSYGGNISYSAAHIWDANGTYTRGKYQSEPDNVASTGGDING